MQDNRVDYRVIIAGGRDFYDYAFLENRIGYYLSSKVVTHHVIIVSGTARGADSLGERYAHEHDLHLEAHPADWDKFGKSAGYRRNAEMAASSDALIAFWDGQSRGTANMISLAKSKGLKVAVVRY